MYNKGHNNLKYVYMCVEYVYTGHDDWEMDVREI